MRQWDFQNDRSGTPVKASMLGLFAAALVVRIGLVAAAGQLGHTPPKDYREYVVAGQRLLNTGTIVTPMLPDEMNPGPSAFMPPAYVALVAGVYGLVGIESSSATLILQVLNAIAGSAAVMFVLLGARAVAGSAAGWISAIILAFNPLAAGFTGYIWDTSLFVLGASVSLWLSVRLAKRSGSAVGFGLFGLWLGALALLNPALTLTYPLLVLWPLVRSRTPAARAAACCVASVIGWAVAIAPWTVRNYVQFGELMYVRVGFMHELWLGVSPEADQNPSKLFNTQFLLRNPELQKQYSELGEPGFIRDCGRRAKEAIARDPARYLKLTATRVVDFWAGTVRTHAEAGVWQWWPTSPRRQIIAAFAAAETVIVLLGMVLPAGRRDRLWLVCMALAFSATYAATHVQVRYRTPIEPVLAILCGLTLARITRKADCGGVVSASDPGL